MGKIFSRKSYVVSCKAIVLFIAYSLMLTLSLVGCTKREITNMDSKGTNIICFGDSLTFGYGVEPAKESYPIALGKLVQMPVINSGIDGDTTSEALKRLDSDVLARDPFLVIIEFGGNDFLRKVPFEVSVNNIKEMTERIQKAGAMVAITDISAGLLMKDYRPAYKKVAQEKGAIFIPSIMRGIITNPKLKSDFMHPNCNGYKLIAERVYHAIRDYLPDDKT